MLPSAVAPVDGMVPLMEREQAPTMAEASLAPAQPYPKHTAHLLNVMSLTFAAIWLVV